jgi:hypothetical protein
MTAMTIGLPGYDRWGTCLACKPDFGQPRGSHRERCVQANTFPCSWYVLDYNEDGPYERPCNAAARETEHGFKCEAGHEHVNAQTRYDEGWDYAEDAEEARYLARNGVMPVQMDGKPFI